MSKRNKYNLLFEMNVHIYVRFGILNVMHECTEKIQNLVYYSSIIKVAMHNTPPYGKKCHKLS